MNVDPQAEQRVIGAVILTAGEVLQDLRLSDDDFATPAHAELWTGIGRYLESGKPLTANLLLAYVRDRVPRLLPVLTQCLSSVGVPQEAPYFAESLRNMTARRRIEGAQARLGQLANSATDMTPEELAEQSRAIVDNATDRSIDTGGVTTFGDSYLASIERWSKPDTSVLPTGWHGLDDLLTGGLRPGHLCVVGARPGVGKSMLATELARRVAGRNALTLFHSLEMTREEVTDRIAAAVAKVPLTALTGGTASDMQIETLTRVLSDVADWPLYIDDRSSITVTGVRGKARDLTRKGELALIIVDYLQLVTPYDRKANREQQVASVSRGLKLLAKDLGVPVVALAQVGRSAGNERPSMANLRESGGIEADADEILLLHRNFGVPEEDDDLYGLIEVNVVKNRHGTTGPVRLAWLPAGGTIGDAHR